MKSSTVIAIVVVLSVIGIIIYSASGITGDKSYNERIEKGRKEKDDFMKNGEGSPFAKSPEQFTGLKYFPPNAKYRISADLEPIENKQVVRLQTSDGKEQQYVEYARATFTLDKVRCSLLILEVIEQGPNRGGLFLAFADQTSAIETYGAGRYLDLKKVPGATNITLDFNEAYNPYCAYNEEFSCPFPPKENLLNVIISAGEKTYKE